MKRSPILLILASYMLNGASALTCYSCLLCPTVGGSIGTQSCEGTQTIAGVTMPNKCASINIYDGPSKGVSRVCAPNVIDGCMDIDYGGYKANICYCTTDLCNTHVFDNRPTASPPTTPLGQKLRCYDCADCPTTSSSTPTRTCEGTQVIAGVEMELKCATFHIYEGPYTGYARQCSPNVINGCLDMDYMGYKANVCYCTTDLCNGGRPELTSTKLPYITSMTGSGDDGVAWNDSARGSETSTHGVTSTIVPNSANKAESDNDGRSNEAGGDDPGNGASKVTGTFGTLVSLIILKLLMK